MSDPKVEINEDTVRRIASLARMKLSPEETRKYVGDLAKVLDYVAQLNEVNTEGVEPLIHGFPLEDHFREDVGLRLSEAETKEIVACSAEPLYDQFRVPEVLGGGS